MRNTFNGNRSVHELIDELKGSKSFSFWIGNNEFQLRKLDKAENIFDDSVLM